VKSDGAAMFPAAPFFFPSCPGLSRASTSLSDKSKKDVDGRDKPGHDDGVEIVGWVERSDTHRRHLGLSLMGIASAYAR
jgi:hypothetical protein